MIRVEYDEAALRTTTLLAEEARAGSGVPTLELERKVLPSKIYFLDGKACGRLSMLF